MFRSNCCPVHCIYSLYIFFLFSPVSHIKCHWPRTQSTFVDRFRFISIVHNFSFLFCTSHLIFIGYPKWIQNKRTGRGYWWVSVSWKRPRIRRSNPRWWRFFFFLTFWFFFQFFNTHCLPRGHWWELVIILIYPHADHLFLFKWFRAKPIFDFEVKTNTSYKVMHMSSILTLSQRSHVKSFWVFFNQWDCTEGHSFFKFCLQSRLSNILLRKHPQSNHIPSLRRRAPMLFFKEKEKPFC